MHTSAASFRFSWSLPDALATVAPPLLFAMALPEQADPSGRARLLAALSVGTEIIHLRHFAPRFGAAAELDAALEAFACGDSEIAIGLLRHIDRGLVSQSDAARPTTTLLRMRGRILVICEALSGHASYFDAEQCA